MYILQDENSIGVNFSTWYCELEDETGNETEEELEAKIKSELSKISSSVAPGSIAEVLLRKGAHKGLRLKIKSISGDWVDL